MNKSIFKILNRQDEVCPWWLCFTFDNPIRKLLHDPLRILNPYVKQGNSVLDIGPGMGYFTFPLSQIVGQNGKVVALDIQEVMLKRLEKKIRRRHVANIETKLYDGNLFSLKNKFDFVLLFWMYHEVTDKHSFIREIKSVITKNSILLITEPKMHVNRKNFDKSLSLFTESGFSIIKEPSIALSRSVVLQKIN